MGRKPKTIPVPIINNYAPENTFKESVAMTREIINAQISALNPIEWTDTQKRLFTAITEKIDWTRSGNSNIIEISNKEVAQKLGWNFSESNERQVGYEIRTELKKMYDNCDIALQDPYTGKWFYGHLIACAGGDSHFTYVEIPKTFISHFEGLYQLGKSFPAYMAPDIYQFKSALTYNLFLDMRMNGVSGGRVNEREYTVNELKEILKISNNSYIKNYVDKESGLPKSKFDHTNFKKKVITPVLTDIDGSETIDIVKSKNNELFTTVKEGGKIVKYKIRYKINSIKQVEQKRYRRLETTNVSKDKDIIELEEDMYTFLN